MPRPEKIEHAVRLKILSIIIIITVKKYMPSMQPKQGVALTGRNNTGPPRAAPW